MSTSFTTTRALCSLALAFAAASCSDSPPMVFVSEPTIDSFAVTQSPITKGSTTALVASFKDGVGSIDQGVGDVTSGQAITVAPSETTTYTLTVTGRSMRPVTATAVVEIVDAPDAPSLSAPTYVTAHQSGYIASIQEQEGCTYAWSIEGGFINPTEEGEEIVTGTSITFTAGESGVVTLRCTVSNRLGTSVSATAKSTIVLAPLIPAIEMAPLVSQGNSYGASVREPVATSTYHWTIEGGTLASDTGSGIDFTPTGEPGTSVSVTCVEINQAGTEGIPSTAEAPITAPPGNAHMEAPDRVTALVPGYQASVAPQENCTYLWTIAGGTIEGDPTTPSISFTASESGSITLTCRVTNLVGDASAVDSRSIPIVAAPAIPAIDAPPVVTAGRSHTASLREPVPGSTYAWTVAGGAAATLTGTSITFTPAGDAGNVLLLTCTETNAAGAVGTPGSATSAIAAPPLQPAISAPQFATPGEEYTALLQNPVATSSYVWSIQGGALSSNVGTSVSFTPDGAPGSTVVLTCNETNRALVSGVAGTASVILVAAPVTPAIQMRAAVTAGEGYLAAIAAPVGLSSYSWTIEGGSLVTSTGTTIRFFAGDSGTVTLSAVETNRAGTAGTPGSTSSAIFAAPLAPTLSAPYYVTVGAQATASVERPVQGSTYAWTIAGGSLVDAAGTSVTFTAGAVGNIALSCSEKNGAGSTGRAANILSIIVAAPVAPAISTPAHVTAGRTFSARLTSPSASSTYAWSATGGTLLNATGTSVTVTPTGAAGTQVSLSCTETNRAGTPGAQGSAQSAIVAEPGTPSISAPPFVTAGSGYSASVQSPAATSTYTWSITGGSLQSATGTSVTFTPAGLSGTVVTLRCTEKNQADTPGIQGLATSTITAAPTIPVIEAPLQAVAGIQYAASVTNLVATSTYAWTITGATPATAIGPSITFVPTGAPGSNVTFACVETNRAGTVGSAGDKTVEIVDLPQKPVIAAPPFVTLGLSYQSSVQNVIGTSTYEWTIEGGAPENAHGTTVTFTPTGSTVTLLCKERTTLGLSEAGRAVSVVVAPPTTPVIEAPNYVTPNQLHTASVQSPVATSTYAWTITGATPATAIGPSITFVPTGAPGSNLTFTCVETNRAGTAGPAGTASSAIATIPNAPSIEAPVLVTKDLSANASIKNPITGSTYTWTITGGSPQSATGTNITFTPTGNAGAIVTLSCTETSSTGMTGSSGVAVSTIVAPPAALSISAPQYVSAGRGYVATVQSPSATSTYHWGITGGELSAANGTSVGFIAGSSGFVELTCVEKTLAGSTGAPATATSTIVPAPSKPLLDVPAYITSGYSGTAKVRDPVDGSTYSWSISGGTLLAATGATVTFTAGNSGAVALICVETNQAQISGNGGTAVSTIVAPPGVPVVEVPPYVTAGETYRANIKNPASGDTYAWGIANGTLVENTGSTISFIAGESGSTALSATEHNRAGTAGATPGTASSTIVARPRVPAMNVKAIVTAGMRYEASVQTPVEGSTYEWTIMGATPTAASGTSVSFVAGSSGSIELSCVETNKAGSTGEAGTGSSAIAPKPATPIITAPTYIGSGMSGYQAVVPSQENCTYFWSIAGGSIAGSTDQPSITFSANTSGIVTLTCKVTNAAGDANTQGSRSINILPPPNATITAPDSVAPKAKMTASVAYQSGSTYAWSVTNGTLDRTDAASVTVTAGEIGQMSLTCTATNQADARTTKTKTVSVIDHQIDIVWIIDDSGSVYSSEWNMFKNLILDMLSELDRRNINWRIAGVTITDGNHQYRVPFDFLKSYSAKNAIQHLKQHGGFGAYILESAKLAIETRFLPATENELPEKLRTKAQLIAIALSDFESYTQSASTLTAYKNFFANYDTHGSSIRYFAISTTANGGRETAYLLGGTAMQLSTARTEQGIRTLVDAIVR